MNSLDLWYGPNPKQAKAIAAMVEAEFDVRCDAVPLCSRWGVVLTTEPGHLENHMRRFVEQCSNLLKNRYIGYGTSG